MYLRNLYNIKQSLSTETRILLITNQILSTIDYCSFLLIACNDTQLRPLKLIINKSIRFIYSVKFRQHVSPFYAKCHFLNIKNRIIFKACLTAHKIFYRTAPIYLEEKIERFTPNFQSMTLRVGPGRDTFMFETSLRQNNQSIIFLMKERWNKLPLQLRKCEEISTFKKRLKTHLMQSQNFLVS